MSETQHTHKTYQMRISIEDVFHCAIVKEQKARREQGLPFLSQEKIAKIFMIEGIIARRLTERVEDDNLCR